MDNKPVLDTNEFQKKSLILAVILCCYKTSELEAILMNIHTYLSFQKVITAPAQV